jgi:hypothetical protein
MADIQQIGGASEDIAELAGRTQPRATDFMQALQDMVICVAGALSNFCGFCFFV